MREGYASCVDSSGECFADEYYFFACGGIWISASEVQDSECGTIAVGSVGSHVLLGEGAKDEDESSEH